MSYSGVEYIFVLRQIARGFKAVIHSKISLNLALAQYVSFTYNYTALHALVHHK